MKTNTHVDKFPSGVEFEVKELTGKHQRILTEQSSKTHNQKLDEVLADILVRVGTDTEIKEEFIKTMLACDKQKALITVRQFTLGFQKEFEFHWDYKSSDGAKKTHKLSIPLEDANFPTKPVMCYNPNFTEGSEDEKCSKELITLEEFLKDTLGVEALEYEHVLKAKKVEIILPRSEERVTYTMLDGDGEEIGSKIKKSERSTHTPIRMRKPVRFDAETGTPIQLNLDKLAYLDIEHLRKSIKEVEGNVDTEIMFEHPEAEQKQANEKDVIVDLLSTTAFFFPSEAI